MEISTLQVFENNTWPVATGGEGDLHPAELLLCGRTSRIFSQGGDCLHYTVRNLESEKSCALPSVTHLINWRAGIWTQFYLIAKGRLFPHHRESLWFQNRQTQQPSPAASYTEHATVLENFFSPSKLCTDHLLQSPCSWYREKRGRGREGGRESLMSINFYYPKAQGSILWAPWQVCSWHPHVAWSFLVTLTPVSHDFLFYHSIGMHLEVSDHLSIPPPWSFLSIQSQGSPFLLRISLNKSPVPCK